MSDRYFSTCNLAKSGSFVRAEKLKASAKRHRTVSEALKDKYDLGSRGDHVTMELDQRVKVELVGMAKLRRQRGGIDRLQEVSLIDAGISSAVRHLMSSHQQCSKDFNQSFISQ